MASSRAVGAQVPAARVGVTRWLTWLVGMALVAALVLAVRHASEERAFVRLVRQARPHWLLVAVLLQAATYVFQSEVWRVVLRPGGASIGTGTLLRLTVARLAIDQVVPSAGLGGTILIANALEARKVSRSVVMAGVVIDTASLYATYAFGLGAALVIALAHHRFPVLFALAATVFVAFALAVTLGFVRVSGHEPGPVAHRLLRLKPLGAGLRMLEQADARLAHDHLLLAEATACQLSVVLLDAATIWVLIASLGATASAPGVFASYMMSTVLRLIGILPGGLGVFEAASVLTLRMLGVELSVSLSATLLFRGLSFWLPLGPGLWFARRYAASAGKQPLAPMTP
jgi:Mg2+-importing ATPase